MDLCEVARKSELDSVLRRLMPEIARFFRQTPRALVSSEEVNIQFSHPAVRNGVHDIFMGDSLVYHLLRNELSSMCRGLVLFGEANGNVDIYCNSIK